MRDMLKLLELVLAVLGSWDILRRLLPVKVPVVLGEIGCVGLAGLLLTFADQVILLSLAVPGALMVLAIILSPEPHHPWGPRVMEVLKLYRQRHRQGMHEAKTPQTIGRRVPRL